MSTFKELPSKELNGGIQYLVKYLNNYGASIVQHEFSYGGKDGKWELAVTVYPEGTEDINDFELTYATEITDDVIGWLSEEEVEELLLRIQAL